ncbi:TcaA NTF2-like domain-containing protein [Staphylococcus xylosus]|uniref:TcaA NTF2-like domain-containing protein n=5 Tax=Staphylococcus TaxID=1279 RepID=UPI002F913AE7
MQKFRYKVGEKMQKCPKCGGNTRDGQRKCGHCGRLLRQDDSAKMTRSSKETKKITNIKARKIIPLGIAFFIVILLIIIFILLKNFNSPEAQSEILINAIDNNDTQKLSTILSTQNNSVDENEAEAYIRYIKEEVGMDNFVKDVNQKIEKLNKSDTKEADSVTAKNGEDVLRVSKNGRRYLIFDNMNFTAPTKEAIIKPKYETTYKFKSGDKQKTVVAEKNKATSLGKFIPGDYALETKKEMENGQFDGHLRFDFNNSNNETVDVHEDFDEAYIQVELSGASEIDKDSVKVKINDKTYDYAKAKEIGPYPKTKDLTISAEGEAKKKMFKSAETTVKTDNLKDKTKVTMNFDSDKIKEYVEKKEKEENSFRNKVANFFGNYTAAMNSAHSQSNFSLVSNYLKKDTDNYKATKGGVKGNNLLYLQQPQITEIVKQGKTYYVTANTLKENGQYGSVDYQLEGDDDAGNLKIVKYSE